MVVLKRCVNWILLKAKCRYYQNFINSYKTPRFSQLHINIPLNCAYKWLLYKKELKLIFADTVYQ